MQAAVGLFPAAVLLSSSYAYMPAILPLSPATTARLAGGCYLLTIITGMAGELLAAPLASDGATLLSFVCYGGVCVLLYYFFAAAQPLLSLLAAGSGLVGCLLGGLRVVHLRPLPVHYLVFFGVYCLLLSVLIWRSRLLPRWLSSLLACSGLGWLVFLSPALAHQAGPYPLISGLVGEGALTGWLLLGRLPRLQHTETADTATSS